MANQITHFNLLSVDVLRCSAGEEFALKGLAECFGMFVCDGKAYSDIGVLIGECKWKIAKGSGYHFDHDVVVPDKDVYCFNATDASESINCESMLKYIMDSNGRFDTLEPWLVTIAGFANKLLNEANDMLPKNRVPVREYSFVLVFRINWEPEYGEYGYIEHYEPHEELMGVLDTSNLPIRSDMAV